MDEKEFLAIKLGFESAEEMEKYHDLCRGDFKDDIAMTKELCTNHIIENGFEDLLNAPREERLEKKIYFDFGGLVECVKMGDDESVQQLKSLIDFELSELNKCYDAKEKKML